MNIINIMSVLVITLVNIFYWNTFMLSLDLVLLSNVSYIHYFLEK